MRGGGARSLGLASLVMAASVATANPGPSFDGAINAARRGDAATAFASFAQLARAGDPRASFNLAVLYALGEGVVPDPAAAFYWAWRARLGGVALGRDLSDHLAQRLPQTTQAEIAARLVEELTQIAVDDPATGFLGLARVAMALPQPDQSPQQAYIFAALAAAYGAPHAADLRDALMAEMDAEDAQSAQAASIASFAEWCEKLAPAQRHPACHLES